jgi:tetratricopeptide (TPR) repeat protein
LDAFTKSVRPVDGELKAKYDLARYFQRIGRHVIAVEALNEILAMAPRHVDAHNALGYSLDCLGDYPNAQRHYKTAIALNPELDYAYNNLGYSLLLAGDPPAAVVALEKAVAMNESCQKYIKNLGYAYYKNGKPAMAENAFGRLDDPAAVERIKTRLGLPLQNELTYMPLPPEADHSAEAREPWVDVTIDPMDFPVADGSDRPDGGHAAVIEVSNGNGVRRMAGAVGNYLKRNGMRVTRLTNADHFGHARTVIYYREGYQDEARQVQRLLPGLSQAGHLVAARLDSEPIRVLIGRDLVMFQAAMTLDVDVEVTNGNGVDGMASRLRNHLQREGFRVGRLSNADHFGYQNTVVFYGRDKADEAMLIADALPGGGRVRMIELNQAGMHIQILMGADMVF